MRTPRLHLTTLKVEGVRNLSSSRLSFCSGINFFFGENGSGKSSLLEAIYILAHTRSFRTRNFKSIIHTDAAQCSVFGEYHHHLTGVNTLGVSRTRAGQVTAKSNGAAVQSSALMAASLPIIVIDHKTFSLLEGPGEERRRYLDWLVFHVKHHSLPLFQSCNKVLKQRNSYLKRVKIADRQLAMWTEQFITLSEEIDGLRRDIYQSLSQHLSLYPIFNQLGVSHNYKASWQTEEGHSNLHDKLNDCLDRDIALGRTSVGMHRTDLAFTVGKTTVNDTLSRGQKKNIIIHLYLAQAKLFIEEKGFPPLFLIDDLPAELDLDGQVALVQSLTELGIQIFITGISLAPLLSRLDSLDEIPRKVFHVKHGEISHVDETE